MGDVRVRGAGGAAPQRRRLGTPTTFGDQPNGVYVQGVTIDPDAGATLALRRQGYMPLPGGGVGLVQGAPATGWGTPQWLDAGTDVRVVRLAAGGGARAVAWDTQPAHYPERPGAARVALAAPGQPFQIATSVAEEPSWPLTPLVTADAFSELAVTGGGEALALWTGPNTGVTVHPVTAAGSAEPTEPLLADACRSYGAVIGAGAGAQAVAVFAQRGGLWIAYRAAGAPARPRRPRICDLTWASMASGHGIARAGPVDLYVHVSKPVAALTVTVRRGATRAHRRIGPRPTGYVRVRLPGRGGAPRLSAGRYRVIVGAVDRAGRHAVPRAATLTVVARSAVSAAA